MIFSQRAFVLPYNCMSCVFSSVPSGHGSTSAVSSLPGLAKLFIGYTEIELVNTYCPTLPLSTSVLLRIHDAVLADVSIHASHVLPSSAPYSSLSRSP